MITKTILADKTIMKQKVTISNSEELYQVLQIDMEKEQLLNDELFDFSAIINTTTVKLDNLDFSQNKDQPRVNTDILCRLKCLEVLKIRYGCFSNIQRLHQLRSLKTIELQYSWEGGRVKNCRMYVIDSVLQHLLIQGLINIIKFFQLPLQMLNAKLHKTLTFL
ncbi:Hypothetical_protein [Hexamita inflata]|uniref:Hypothetical_protein n=1 Tax=Hexamita inflata TaxID=28002 RepID=A0AA86P797_9EUKA|nr:Hypothetical protein HINF_LOCUS19315 [Hexamita inflata]